MEVREVARTIRNVRRYTEILEVLVRQGFADTVSSLGLDRLVERGARLVGRPAASVEQLPRAARMRIALEQLGPTFMKLGQMLSCRKDLIPSEWADEFAKLQSAGPKLPFAEIRVVLDREFKGKTNEVFASIDEEPLAAASIAQVHRARLSDGTPVVLKIMRPEAEDVTRSDLEILRAVASFAESHLAAVGFSPVDVVREFARELRRELDFTFEGRSTDTLRRTFESNPNVRFPAVYWRATTRRVLALEEFKGILLSNLGPDDLTPEERTAVVAYGADAVARQCLEIGLFHADPHPGNLFAIRGENGIIAGFIDCGMTGRIEPRTMELLARLLRAIAAGDVDEVISVVTGLADVPPDKLDERGFRADMSDFAHAFAGATVEQINLPEILEDFFDKLRHHHIRFPAELVMLVKALTTIQAVAVSLDPSFDMIAHLRPYVEKILRERYGFAAMRRRTRRTLADYATLAEDLPREVRFLVSQARRNKLAVNLEHRGLTRLTRTIEHASRNIGFSLMLLGLIVSSAILVHADDRGGAPGLRTMGIGGFIAAGVLTILHILSNRKWLADRDKE